MILPIIYAPFTLHMRMYCDVIGLNTLVGTATFHFTYAYVLRQQKLCKSRICAVFSLCNTSNTYACFMWWRTLCHQFIGANLPAFFMFTSSSHPALMGLTSPSATSARNASYDSCSSAIGRKVAPTACFSSLYIFP